MCENGLTDRGKEAALRRRGPVAAAIVGRLLALLPAGPNERIVL